MKAAKSSGEPTFGLALSLARLVPNSLVFKMSLIAELSSDDDCRRRADRRDYAGPKRALNCGKSRFGGCRHFGQLGDAGVIRDRESSQCSTFDLRKEAGC